MAGVRHSWRAAIKGKERIKGEARRGPPEKSSAEVVARSATRQLLRREEMKTR